MSEAAQARFEIVSGPYDGLRFTMSEHGAVLNMAPEGLRLDPDKVLQDVAAVRLEAGGAGVTLSAPGGAMVNDEPVGESFVMADGDCMRIGQTEAVLLEHAAAGEGQGDEDGGAESAALSGRRCLRPGCGALNPPTAKWCSTCGWDLEEPE